MIVRTAQNAIDEFVEAIAEYYQSVQQSGDEQSKAEPAEFVSSLEQDLMATLRERLSKIDTVKKVEETPTVEWSGNLRQDGSPQDTTNQFAISASPEQFALTLDSEFEAESLTRTASGELSPAAELSDAPAETVALRNDVTDRDSRASDFEAPTLDGEVSAESSRTTAVRSGKTADAKEFSYDGAETLAAKARLRNRGPSKGLSAPPGYEILSVLGKGGMGIVYKAKHVPLNRTVAVKMIISGELASDDQIKRFQREAEAAAHLSHPNIVQIYEVGSHQGLPFFSLEFVDGPSLSHMMKETTLSSRNSATLLIPVARAIQYSHDKGVLHRDLKPQNILLSQTGVPKVADFGLAKRLDAEDADKTRTGIILGTPGYMAPEQAHNTDAVGPQTDVYALGCILYYLITGKAPFTAPTPFETVRQLLLNDPVAPSKLQDGLDQDIETICLKALEKELPKRYQSAAEFADELQRFLDGKPIVARAITRTERVQKWCKRNPKVAVLSGIAASLLACLLFGGMITSAVIWNQKKEVVAANVIAVENALTAKKNEEKAVAAKAVADKNAEAASVQEKNAVDTIKSLTFVVQEKMSGRANLLGLRQELLQTVRNGVDRLEKNENNAAQRNMITAGIHSRLGDINMELGQPGQAYEEYNKCLAVFKELEKTSELPYASINNAKIYQNLGDAARQEGNYRLAHEHFSQSLEIRRQSLQQTNDTKIRIDVATSLGKLGSLAQARGDLRAAERYIEEALQLRQEVYNQNANDVRSRSEVQGAKLVLAKIKFQQGDRDLGLSILGDAVDDMQDLGESLPDSKSTQQNVAMFEAELGVLQLYVDQLDEAKENFESAASTLRILHESEPNDLRIHQELEDALYGLSVTDRQLGNNDNASESMTAALELRRESLAWEPSNSVTKLRLLAVLARAGELVEGVLLADELSKAMADDDTQHYDLACGYALLAEGCQNAPDVSDREKLPTPQELQQRCIKALKRALVAGFLRPSDLQLDPDLDSVRETSGFQSLVSEALVMKTD